MGKGERGLNRSLPVVAMGSIPPIYRRTFFSYRAILTRLPQERGVRVIILACKQDRRHDKKESPYGMHIDSSVDLLVSSSK
uniref:Uncharacterized protein n=1 Tax=Candidatus Kentrum sp. TC TaxID=2126339 RepID=A0A450ZCP7_9GAMM|nr:MAG: hypothetical protein BECKTC1821F_GA0114240_100192 [Candidatus Kentron sp. TC]